jgi:hypothetical protein
MLEAAYWEPPFNEVAVHAMPTTNLTAGEFERRSARPAIMDDFAAIVAHRDPQL